VPRPPKDQRDVVADIRDAVGSSPRKSKRVLLKTLLRAFRFNSKTKDRATVLTSILEGAGMNIFPNLADSGRDEWITLTLVNPQVPVEDFAGSASQGPLESAIADPWFDEIMRKAFASEKEVEIRFIIPLLHRLGYGEDDRSDGYPVEIFEGVRKTTKEADFVLFDGVERSKDTALMVVEAKASGKHLQDYIGQARTYAIWLGTPYYLVTNGGDIRVFLYRSAIESDVEVLAGSRQNLRGLFPKLYNLISHTAIVEYKRRLKTVMPV